MTELDEIFAAQNQAERIVVQAMLVIEAQRAQIAELNTALDAKYSNELAEEDQTNQPEWIEEEEDMDASDAQGD